MRTAPWSATWALLIGLMALLSLFTSDNASRWVGQHFARGFEEVRTYHPSRDDGESDPYTTEFRTSDDTLQPILNNGLVMAVAPAAIYALLAAIGYRYLNRWITMWLVHVRLSGQADTWPRLITWAVVVGIPLAAFVYTARYGLGSNDYVTRYGA